ALLVFSAWGAQAQTTTANNAAKLPAPLVQAVKKAVTSNPDVQSKFNGFLSAGSLRDIARAGYMPQIDFSASVGNENRTTPTVPSTSYNTTAGQLSADLVLFDGFFTTSEVNRLGAGVQTRYYELTEAAETVALDSFKAYTDVLRYRELVDLATQNYVEHKQSAQLVEERVNGGVGRRVDVEQANGRLAQAESNLLTELTNLHDASARYLRVVGEKPAASLPSLAEPFRLGVLPTSTEALMHDGILNSPTLLAAVQNARASQLAVNTSKSGFLPRVDLQAYGTKGNNNAVAGDNQAQGAALALKYNLFKGGADQANGKFSGYSADQARDLQDKACRDVRQVLSLAFSDVRSLTEKLDYEDRHRLATEKTREAYRQQFEIGQRTLLDLLDTQNEFFESSRSYTNARHDQALAQARTLAAMGQLVSTMGVTRTDMPKPGDDENKPDLNKLCEGTETAVDTVDSIKAGLNFAKPAKPLNSYVVLLPDRNNVVGKVIVEGKGGKQVLEEAQKGVKADGGGGTFAVSDEQLKRDFGGAMAALPKAPERFVLYFQRGTDVLTPESKALLPQIVQHGQAHPGLDVSVVGHTDTSGSEKVNEVLGRERASFVAKQLRDLGLKTDALSIESQGKKRLEVATPDNTKEQRNRRVEVILR
ncbi:MAG: TolC family outer membrane protein, partial [Rhodoferax sp.]|nr:TolC family outer membrane protein [Rhodoferax sp.]